VDINYHRNNYFLYPKELLKKRLLDEGWWGGWRSAQWDVCPADWSSYVSSTWVPKLAPLVYIDTNGQLLVSGHNVNNTYAGYFRNTWGTIKGAVQEVMDKVTPVPKKGPVLNRQKEEWVEKLMWDMGMARSNYKPEVKDLFPHMNVGTVGHIDYGRSPFRQYIGRATYHSATGEDIINEMRKMMSTPEHCDVKPIGPQTIEEYQAYLRAFDPAKKEPTLAGLFFTSRK